jgi:hypothetical protein
MKLAQPFVNSPFDDVMAALDGGKLVVYSVARPSSPDLPVQRSGVLATFTFASPAFAGYAVPSFESNPVVASGTGTPGFARAFKADGSPVADFSVGPAGTDIKLSEVSTTPSFPVTLTALVLNAPEK